jgi:hypothetical protein
MITDLQAIELNKDMRLCSFDIENMYTNIPEVDIMNIVNSIIEKNHKIDRNAQKINNAHVGNSARTKLFPSRPRIL